MLTDDLRDKLNKKEEAEKETKKNHKDNAIALAKTAAKLLKEEYRAEKVYLYGSLAYGNFTKWSDIDLMVEKLQSSDYLKAVSKVLSMSNDIEINIIRKEDAYDSLIDEVINRGIEL